MNPQLSLFPGNELSYNDTGRRSSLPLKRSVESRADRIHLRNRVLVARLYYWQEIMRRRTDDVMIILSENEFFVDERTIQNALIEQADYYTDLCRRHVTARQLQRKYPSFKF